VREERGLEAIAGPPYPDLSVTTAAPSRRPLEDRRQSGDMSGSIPWSGTPQSTPMNDPNELLNRIRRIDQTTAQTFHWVRIGVVVLILLSLVIVFIG